MIGIRQAYSTVTKTLGFGVEGYHVEKKYFDPKNQSFSMKKQLKRKQTKKGSYLDDYVAIHGKIPGPGVYDFTVKGSINDSIKQKKINYSDKKTIFDEMCDKQLRQKKPAPGQYEPKQKKRPQSASTRRPKVVDRATFLDAVQYQSSVTPGVGAYNPRVNLFLIKPQSANVMRKDRMKPEDWIKKHKQEQKDSTKIKQPTPFSYNPTKMEKKSFSKACKGWTTWGSIDRFKDSKANINVGPGKYIAHSQWGKPVNFGSQGNTVSVYYR